MSRQEKLIIIFLLSCAVVGLAVSFYQKSQQSEIRVVPSSLIKEFAYLKNKTSHQKLININTADAQELTSLSGIGPALAEKIIKYRRENDEFLLPEDITKVLGIGSAKYQSIKDLITTFKHDPR